MKRLMKEILLAEAGEAKRKPEVEEREKKARRNGTSRRRGESLPEQGGIEQPSACSLIHLNTCSSSLLGGQQSGRIRLLSHPAENQQR